MNRGAFFAPRECHRIKYNEVMALERKIDEAAVWRRVTAASEAAEKQEKSAESPPEQRLLATLRTGELLASAYSALGRSGRRLHSQLAQRQIAENQRLKSLYFLQTGQTPRLSALGSNRDPKESYAARLRWLLQIQGAQQEALEKLSEASNGKDAKILSELAADAGERWKLLLQELGKALEKS